MLVRVRTDDNGPVKGACPLQFHEKSFAGDGKDRLTPVGPRAPASTILRIEIMGSYQPDAFNPLETIRTIHECAPIYRDRLLERHVLFIPSGGEAPLETFYAADNFMHLCGLNYPGMSAREFWDRAISGRLPSNGIRRNNGGTVAKGRVLPTLVRIDAKAIMMVRNPRLPGNTKADAICANLPCVLGYTNRGGILRPCTALEMPSERLSDVKNIIMVVKTEPRLKTYGTVSKQPKKRDAAKRQGVRRSLKLYEGGCCIDFDAVDATFRQ